MSLHIPAGRRLAGLRARAWAWARPLAAACATAGAAWLLASCGASGPEAGAAGVAEGRAFTLSATDREPRDLPASPAEARRFLAQATFGPTEAEVALLQRIGYAAWIDRQLAMQPSAFRARWEEIDAALRTQNPALGAGAADVINVVWERMLTAPDQLRLRVAYALSQIVVVSAANEDVFNQPRALAAWMDMLSSDGLSTYRQLLDSAARHPLMGRYLSHLRNQKADGNGRVPDENFARELMQLFTIGVVQLQPDGSPLLVNGQTVDSYTPADISVLAQVFTGWGLACPDHPSDACFHTGASASGAQDPDREFKPMVPYLGYHAMEPKMFLGQSLTPWMRSDPSKELKAALDMLDAHPNTGPFISRQLIQRLVTSNPSKAYVAAVAAVWANSGAGVRGDIRAVVKAILTHPEARRASRSSGKLREPVLRLTAFLRAFAHVSDTGWYRVGFTDDPGTQLGQSPLRAPSVFNFYRPGYVLPNSQSAAAGLVAPEAQLLGESSVSGWVNFMVENLLYGIGSWNGRVAGVQLDRRDLQRDWTAEMRLAESPGALADAVVNALVVGQPSTVLRDEVLAAVQAIAVPAPAADGSNQAAVDAARLARVRTALLLVLASPDFLIQK